MPEEFGLIGMLAIFMGLGVVLFEGGLTSSLIRSNDLEKDDYSTVFYFNIIGAFLVYILIFVLSPFIADFYDQPALTAITRVYCFSFIISAFGTVQNTILTKELKFKKQVLISVPALLISSVVGIVMAYYGFGVWSLVASFLVNAFFTTLFLWLTSDWYPSLDFNKEKFKMHFNYGYKLTLSGILDVIFTNIYQIIIGRYYSAARVGYYTRANSLMMLPIGNISGALNKVIFPIFSKVQDDIERFKDAYKKVMQMVLFLVTPIIVLMAFLATPLVSFLFGAKWLPIVPIFQIICFTGILYPIHLYNLIVLQVKGRSDLFLKLEVLKKVLIVIILIISYYFGFYALLYGQIIFSVIALFINTHYAGKMLKYGVLAQLRDICPIFVLGALMGFFIYIIDIIMRSQLDILRLLAGSFSGILIYVFFAWLIKFDSINDIKKLRQQ